MRDLFGNTPIPFSKPGEGNGRFLGHLASGMPRAEMLMKIEAGEYPDLHPQYRALVGGKR